MKKLENLIPFNHKITVYVPATIDIDKAIDNTKQVEATAKMLSSYFGGATSSPALGFWVTDSMSLVKEKTTIVFAYAADEDFTEHIDDVIEYCEKLCKDMQQEAVAIEIDNKMYFIS